jgi:hypothetical protein
MVLAFALGLFATLVKSDLRFPDELYTALTIYLLFAIGLKGGMKLDGMSLAVVGGPLLAAIALSSVIPVWSFFLLKRVVRLDAANAGAIAAHYGSVSAVTFSAVLAFLEIGKVPVEGYVPALFADDGLRQKTGSFRVGKWTKCPHPIFCAAGSGAFGTG